MGVQLNSRSSRRRLNSEINITPFVDVMLVLLIIFMVTAPMLISGIEVDLPKTKASPLSGSDEPIVISVDKTGSFFLQENKLSPYELEKKLVAVLAEKPQTRIFIKGDRNINYGKVIELFAIVKNIGFSNVALVTEVNQKPDDNNKKKVK